MMLNIFFRLKCLNSLLCINYNILDHLFYLRLGLLLCLYAVFLCFSPLKVFLLPVCPFYSVSRLVILLLIFCSYEFAQR